MSQDEPYSPFAKQETARPKLELQQVCWRMRAPSGRVLTCGIYLTDYGFEVRCGYGEDLLFSRRVKDVPAAEVEADALKATVNDKGTFTELTN
ncbi:MAG: hypothetical protein ABI624_25305 [Casimicrobiaceae bacterium]